jgi:hypothetical protein
MGQLLLLLLLLAVEALVQAIRAGVLKHACRQALMHYCYGAAEQSRLGQEAHAAWFACCYVFAHVCMFRALHSFVCMLLLLLLQALLLWPPAPS